MTLSELDGDLCQVLQKFCDDHKLEPSSADEMLADFNYQRAELRDQRNESFVVVERLEEIAVEMKRLNFYCRWLNAFGQCWDAMRDMEMAEDDYNVK